jgi:ribose 5-phosphate isomerase A
MIKGGGGALVREKILSAMSREMVVIVDETKLVPHLGKHPLPVEITPFCYKATERHLSTLGYHGTWRRSQQGLYVTDNGNYILDIHFPHPLHDPQKDHAAIAAIPGVVETGFFFHLAGRVIVGFFDGRIHTLSSLKGGA